DRHPCAAGPHRRHALHRGDRQLRHRRQPRIPLGGGTGPGGGRPGLEVVLQRLLHRELPDPARVAAGCARHGLVWTMAVAEHVTAPESRRSPAGSEADRRLGRSVLIGLAVLGIIALVGPFLTYLNEVRETQRLLRSRVAREASVYAEALALHFGTLEHELERLASRPQVDLLDENLQPERELLEFTHHNSPFFSAVLFLDGAGVPVWSEPRGVLPPTRRAQDRWFPRLLRTTRRVVDALEPGSRSFVVAAPVLRGGRISGAVVGLVDAGKRGLPGGRATIEGSMLVVSTDRGDVLLPATPPTWTFAAGFPGRLEDLLRRGRAETTDLSGTPEYAAAVQVGDTGLRLLLVVEETPLLAPVRWRFF